MVTNLRHKIVELAYKSGDAHIPSALSILDILWTLYDKTMTKDDQFILSKGHGVLALYAVLEAKNLRTTDELIMGHPHRGGAILASTGSLGHGLPMALGLALAKKIKNEKGQVYCLIGDGECNEGTIWESALVAAHQELDNLIVVLDQNHSSDRAIDMGDIGEKFRAFGWDTEIVNGHHSEALNWVFGLKHNRPTLIVANTIKGKGMKFMENNPEYHHKKITKELYEKCVSSL